MKQKWLLFFIFILTAKSSYADTSYEVKTVCAEYVGTGKKYKVDAYIMDGSQLNERLGSYKFSSIKKYVVIPWELEEFSVIELDYSYGPSSMGTEGTDQKGYKWEISTSTSFCY